MIPIVNKEDVAVQGGKGKLYVRTEPIKNEYEHLLMASILHDIGKFWQRTGNHHHDSYSGYTTNDYGYAGAHSKWSASFVRDIRLNELVENLVFLHHKPESPNGRIEFLSKILSKSDHYSSSEREDIEGTAQPREEPLISIFSNLKIDPKNNTKEHYYPLRKLDLKNLPFPVKSKMAAIEGGYNLTPRYNELWKEFLVEVKRIASMNAISFDTIYYLLKKYTTYIPSAAYVSYPDISLFDHLKTTAAISSCIYQYLLEKDEYKISNDTNHFLLISGDMSGIQNFIYDIQYPQDAQKGMSKRLRGRSFYISITNENIARVIVDKLELTEANILWCGGGDFLILASNTNKTKNIINEYEKEINELLFKKYRGKLFLSMITQSCSGKDLGENFAYLRNKIFYKTSQRKRQKFHNMIDEVFREEEYAPSSICKICGNTWTNNGICNDCRNHEDIGNNIIKSSFIIRSVLKNTAYNKFDFQEFNVGYIFSNEEKLSENIEKILNISSKVQIFSLNDTNFINDDIMKKFKGSNVQISYGFSFLGNTVPLHPEHGMLNFQQIADISKGSKKLGVLKMDIDHLEKLFTIGLGNKVSISRISTMSSIVDIFFSGYINNLANENYILPNVCKDCEHKVDVIKLRFDDGSAPTNIYREKEKERVCNICKEKKISDIYINYSWGDDLLILGPWDIIVRLAKDLRDKFKEFTCNNSDVNISAGIHICNSRFPIARSALISDEILERSKILGRDRISIFTETVKWTSEDMIRGYDELLQLADQLGLLIETGEISKSFAYSLLILLRDTFGDLKEFGLEEDMTGERLKRKKYVPILKYKLVRNVKNKEIREDLNKKLITGRMLPWIEIPASITSLKWREK